MKERGTTMMKLRFKHPLLHLVCACVVTVTPLATQAACAAPGGKVKEPVAKAAAALSPAQQKLHATLLAALNDAGKGDSLARIESLLKQGAPVNASTKGGTTFLMMASIVDAKMVALLLKYHADAKARDKDGWTALHLAALMGHDPQVIELLAAAGAEVNLRAKDGATPLMMACSIAPDPAMLRALIKAGADVNVRGEDGAPLLVTTAMMNQVEAVEVLIAAKVDVNARNKEGASALDVAGTLPTLASAAAMAEKRKLTSEEQTIRARAQHIVKILKQAGAK